MAESFSFFDLQRFLDYINRSSAEGQGQFQLGHIFYGIHAKYPMGHMTSGFQNKSMEALVKYPIINARKRRGVSAGYFFLETGMLNPYSDEQIGYQALKLRIKHPIPLGNGLTIPKSIAKLAACGDNKYCHLEGPVYHRRKFGLIWEREDLSDVLPESEFLSREAESIIKRQRELLSRIN